jgi:hypothetical protein
MYVWFTVVVGINLMLMLNNGYYSAFYVPKHCNVTDDVQYETVQGHNVIADVQVLVDGLKYLFGV